MRNLSDWLSESGQSESYESAEVEVELEGEGTCLWDAAAGHLHHFELEADLRVNARTVQAGDLRIEMRQRLEGTLALGARLGEE